MAQSKLATDNQTETKISVNSLDIIRHQPNYSPEQLEEIERIGKISPYVGLERDKALFARLNYWRDLKMCGKVRTLDRLGLAKALTVYAEANTKRRGKLVQVPASVVYIKAETTCGGKDLLLLILEFLSNPLSCGPLRDLRKRTLGTLKAYKVKNIVVNNADFLAYSAFNELMRIFEELQISVVLVGMPYLDEILMPTSGKKMKFFNIHQTFLRGFSYDTLSIGDTQAVIKTWEKAGLKWSKPINLAGNQEIVKTLHKASQGQLQLLYENLREVAVWCLNHPQGQINHQNVGKALSLD